MEQLKSHWPFSGGRSVGSLTALSHDGRVFPQHGGSRLRQGDDDLQSQLPLHVGQVGVRTQLNTHTQETDISYGFKEGNSTAKGCFAQLLECELNVFVWLH